MTYAAAPFPTQARREWSIILMLTLLAAALRFWGFGRLGLTHFDEGVYAHVGVWSVSSAGPARLAPQVVAYAPPGFPLLIGFAYALLGVSDASALLVSAASGVLCVPIAGWIGRRTIGAGGGASTAAFAALALAHVAFSRKALTDVPFLCTWLAALGLGGKFLERPGVVRAIGFGCAVGVAQNFKYNGWICLGVVALAAVMGLHHRESRSRSELLTTFGLGLLATLVAALCYWPWFSFVGMQPGGYAALLRHQRSHLSGVTIWPDHLSLQLAQVVALSGGANWGLLTWFLAWLSVAVALDHGPESPSLSRWRLLTPTPAVLAVGAALALIPDLGWWIGLACLPWLAADSHPAQRIVASWWLILSVMTPFYHPYARLWLPLHAAGWLLLGGLVVRLQYDRGLNFLTSRGASGTQPRVALLVTILLGCLVGVRLYATPHPALAFPIASHFRPTDDLRLAVASLYARTPRPENTWTRLRVLGRRPLLFYLDLYGRLPVRLLPDRNRLTERPILPAERALVDDVESEHGIPRITASREMERAWTSEKTWQTRLDPVTLLDVYPAAAFEVYRERVAPLSLLSPNLTPPDPAGDLHAETPAPTDFPP